MTFISTLLAVKKILWVRLFCCFLLACTFIGPLAAEPLKGQNLDQVYVSLHVVQEPLVEVLKKITLATGINFIYQHEAIEDARKVSLDLNHVSVREVLTLLFNQQTNNSKRVIIRQQGGSIALRVERIKSPLLNTLTRIDSSRIIFPGQPTVAPIQQEPTESIRGKAVDTDTREALAGATVQLDNTAYGTQADDNGAFSLKNVPPGSYTLRISLIGYADYTQGVTVIKGNVITVQARLKNSDVTLSEVVVEANRIVNNEISVLADRKNSSIIQDGVSAQTIERTASITTVQALQKVTGVSIRDGKYITVRGLTDRNIVVQLNGARLSSSNPTRSAVPLDLIPAQLLDNINVEKTVLPNRPGDAAGAVVELKTKSIPDSFTVSAIAQTGYNDAVGINGNYTSFQGGKFGFFGQGVDNLQLKPEFLALRNIPLHSDLVDRHIGLDYLITDRSTLAAENNALQLNRIEETVTPVLTTNRAKANLNQLYTLTVGNRFKLGKVQRLGLLVGVNYYQRYEQILNGTNNRYFINELNGAETNGFSQSNIVTANRVRLFKQYGYNEQRGTQTTSYGTLAALTYRFTPGNEVSVHYIGNFGFEAIGTQLEGSPNQKILPPVTLNNQGYPGFSPHTDYFQYFLFSAKRSFNTLQFRGEHKLLTIGGQKLQFSWNASGSQSHEQDPDFRWTTLAIDSAGFTGKVGTYNTGYSYVNYKPYYIQAKNRRYFRDLTENNRNIVAEFTLPINVGGVVVTAKTGTYWLRRIRDYNQIQIDPPDPNDFYAYNRSLTQLGGDLNQWVGPQNIGILEGIGIQPNQPYVAGHLYYPTRSGVDYHLAQYITAFYGMVDADLSPKFRFAGGVRIEATDVQGKRDTAFVGIPTTINSYEAYRINYLVRQQEYQWLPSGTLIYHPRKDMNLRLSASRTLARPELGELIPIQLVDPIQQASIKGNPDLRNAIYDAADLRWEWFPRPSEVFAFSVFYKHVANNIERVFSRDTTFDRFGQGNNIISYRNNPNPGFVAGIEVEARKSLDVISYPLRHFFVGFNGFIAKSQTRISDKEFYVLTQYDRNASHIRPLFEQPNYIINANAGYENPDIGLNTNLYFNWTGERLIEINTDGTPNIYERPAPDLDYTFSFKIWRGLIIKGFAKNLINASTDWIYKNPGTNKPFGDYGETYYRSRYRRGREFSLGLSFQF